MILRISLIIQLIDHRISRLSDHLISRPSDHPNISSIIDMFRNSFIFPHILRVGFLFSCRCAPRFLPSFLPPASSLPSFPLLHSHTHIAIIHIIHVIHIHIHTHTHIHTHHTHSYKYTSYIYIHTNSYIHKHTYRRGSQFRRTMGAGWKRSSRLVAPGFES